MLPEDIDDLFRQQLDGHATPPSEALWARLYRPLPAEGAHDDADDSVDTLLRAGLGGHASQPRRELWERLEDEYLRPQPRRRRVAAWWQYSAAAVLLLLLLAGGGLLWRGSFGPAVGGELARGSRGTVRQPAAQQSPETGGQKGFTQPQSVAPAQELATVEAPAAGEREKNKEFFSTQATAPRASTSSTPMASTTPPRRPATAGRIAGNHRALRQQPDAAAGTLAHLGGRKTPTSQSQNSTSNAIIPAITPATHVPETPVLATTTAPAEAPVIIEVDVRRGPALARPATPVVVAAAMPAPARRRGLRLGGLLRQADHLVHGESVNLAEATGLPETVTVQARLGGRLLSKTIQL
jgi:hypothetical protein